MVLGNHDLKKLKNLSIAIVWEEENEGQGRESRFTWKFILMIILYDLP
jgi:hypothetical protein